MTTTIHPAAVLKGLKALNSGEYFDAHEYFEDAWRETPHPTRELYRSLLHISGGFFRLTEERPRAAKKFFTRAFYWLALFPNPYLGLDTSTIKTQIEMLISAIEKGQPSAEILNQYAFQIVLQNET